MLKIEFDRLCVKTIPDYIVEEGISIKRITYKGYGSRNPLLANDTEEHKQMNRRVEFILKA